MKELIYFVAFQIQEKKEKVTLIINNKHVVELRRRFHTFDSRVLVARVSYILLRLPNSHYRLPRSLPLSYSLSYSLSHTLSASHTFTSSLPLSFSFPGFLTSAPFRFVSRETVQPPPFTPRDTFIVLVSPSSSSTDVLRDARARAGVIISEHRHRSTGNKNKSPKSRSRSRRACTLALPSYKPGTRQRTVDSLPVGKMRHG